MKRIALIVLLAAFPFSAVPQSKDQIVVLNGFFTGQEFLDLSASQRFYVITGVIDGLLGSTLVGAPLPNVMKFKDCMAGHKSGQLVAMVEKHVRDRPQEWHASIAVLTFAAMKAGCE